MSTKNSNVQTAEKTATATESKTAFVEKMLSSMRLEPEQRSAETLIGEGLTVANEAKATPEDRFVAGLAALLYNIDNKSGRFDKADVWSLTQRIDEMVNSQVNAVLHHPDFQKMESNWRGL